MSVIHALAIEFTSSPYCHFKLIKVNKIVTDAFIETFKGIYFNNRAGELMSYVEKSFLILQFNKK